MKLITVLFILLATITVLSGQTEIAKSDISGGGNISSSGDIKIIFSVGETSVNEISQGTIHISEGFISPDILTSSDIKDFDNNIKVSVYPNPAKDLITIEFSEISKGSMTLYDINGKILSEYALNNTCKHKINFAAYAQGTYFLMFRNFDNKTFKSFTIIKE